MGPDQPISAWRTVVPMIYSGRYALGKNKGANRLKAQVELDLCNRFVVGAKLLLAESGPNEVRTSLVRGGYHVVAIDSCLSKENLPTLHGSPTDLPFKDSQFDTLISMSTLTAFPDWKEMLREWSRAVCPQGRILFGTHSMDHIVKVAQSRKVSVEDILAIEKATNPSPVPFRLKVDDIIEEANRLGLSAIAIVPYGGIYGRLIMNFWLKGSSADGHLWERLLSWLAVDERMFQFGLFLEERCFAPLTSIVTDRFLVVLEKRANPEGNEKWLARNEAINTMLDNEITAKSIMPFLEEECDAWKMRLNSLLAYPFNQTVLAFLYSAFIDYPNVIRFCDFTEPRHLEFSEKVAGLYRLDDRCYKFVTAWHKLPPFESMLNYDGINLGPCLEYDLMAVVMEKVRVSASN